MVSFSDEVLEFLDNRWQFYDFFKDDVKLSPEQLKDMKKQMEKMKMNKDIEVIKHLMANFDNSTLEQKLVILEDLDYYMHQIDNARDFVSLNGIDKIILPSLESKNEELVEKGAILLGSSAQANYQVQV